MREALPPDAPLGRMPIVGRNRRQPPVELGRWPSIAFALANGAVLTLKRLDCFGTAGRQKTKDAVASLEVGTAPGAAKRAGAVLIGGLATFRAGESRQPHTHTLRSTIRK